MQIAMQDVPQADRLEDVISVVDAVAHGYKTYQSMASAIRKVQRQGRYYRRAAEILGFIYRVGPNSYAVTQFGKKLMLAHGTRRKALITQAVLNTRLFQRIMPFLESAPASGLRREDLESFVGAVTEKSTDAMYHRRTATIISWLESIGLLAVKGDRLILNLQQSWIPIMDYEADHEPLLPTRFDLKEYTDAVKRIKEARPYMLAVIDEAAKERAQAVHIKLINLLANKIRAVGSIPRRNRHIDLAARIGEEMYIFEVKSTTEKNAFHQIRRGVSQLYEYRYLQAAPGAKLVLAIEKPLAKSLLWVTDYLTNDRGILLLWNGDGTQLHCPDSVKSDLSFLT